MIIRTFEEFQEKSATIDLKRCYFTTSDNTETPAEELVQAGMDWRKFFSQKALTAIMANQVTINFLHLNVDRGMTLTWYPSAGRGSAVREDGTSVQSVHKMQTLEDFFDFVQSQVKMSPGLSVWGTLASKLRPMIEDKDMAKFEVSPAGEITAS